MSSKFALLAAGALMISVVPAAAGGSCHGPRCYQLVDTPPVYKTVTEQVVVRPAMAVPRTIPAEYGMVQEKVLVRPARTIAHRVPAVLDTVAEKVMVSPGGKRWQVTTDAYGRTVGCWVVEPAQYAVRHRTVVVQPESVRHEVIPAEYGVRQRTVLTRPAQVVHETIPAVYGERHHQVMVSPGHRGWQPVR